MKALQGRRVVRATITFAVIGALLSSSAYFILGAEARIGWELHIRLNGMAGVRLRG